MESDFGLAIQAQDLRSSIWVPSSLNGYEEIRARLATWVAVEQPQHLHIRPRMYGHFGIQSVLAIYPAALLVRSRYYAISLAALMMVYLLFGIWKVFATRALPD